MKKINKMFFNWANRRWCWRNKDGKLHDGNNVNFTIMAMLSEMIDSINALNEKIERNESRVKRKNKLKRKG